MKIMLYCFWNNNLQSVLIWISEHRALHYYAAEDEQDLSFDKGDIILVYEVNENGWWRGKHGDEVGWFAGSYVEVCCFSSVLGYLTAHYSCNY